MRKIILVLALAGCAPQLGRISGRNPDLFDKETDHLMGQSRGTVDAPAPEVYVKQKNTLIRNADKPNDTGSLFNPDDERNYLFTASGPQNVGRFLHVKIVANRSHDKKKDEAGDKKKEAKGGKDSKDGKDAKDGKGDKPDELEAELLKALPDLEPAVKGEPTLLKAIKMRIAHRYDNGDVLAIVTRHTVQDDQAGEIIVQARVPYDRLASGEELTTDDLLDVHIRDSRGGELAERVSSGWEDEYSLRLSGFNEAKSKAALELVDHKKKLQEATEKLDTKIKAFGEERRQFAKQRDDLNQKKAENEAKVQNLEDKIQEQQSTIEKQQDTIKELTPEDKPSDGKEGSGG